MPRSPPAAGRWSRRLIDSVQDRDGHVVWRAPGLDCDACDDPARAAGSSPISGKQIADPASVFQLITMMQGVVQRGTGVPGGQGPQPPDRRQDRHHARISAMPGSPASRPTS